MKEEVINVRMTTDDKAFIVDKFGGITSFIDIMVGRERGKKFGPSKKEIELRDLISEAEAWLIRVKKLSKNIQ